MSDQLNFFQHGVVKEKIQTLVSTLTFNQNLNETTIMQLLILKFLECNINIDLSFSDLHIYLHRCHFCLTKWSMARLAIWRQYWINSSTSNSHVLSSEMLLLNSTNTQTYRILIPEPVAVSMLCRTTVFHNNHSHKLITRSIQLPY